MALMGLLAGGIWFYRTQEQNMRYEVEKELSAIARLKADQISAWQKDQLSDAVTLCENVFFLQNAARFLADPSGVHGEDLRTILRDQAKQHDYADTLLVDPDGKVIFSLSGNYHLHSGYVSALPTALRKRSPVLIDLHTETHNQAPHISVIAPLFTGAEHSRKPLGAIILISNASEFLFPMIQSWPIPSKTAETLLVRRDGNDVLFLNDLRHQADTALKLRIPLTQNDVPAVMAVLGRKGLFEGKDYRGIDVVSVLLPIPDTTWFMVSKMDTAEAFAELRFRSVILLLLLLGLTAFIMAVGLIFWQQKKKNHYQILYHTEARLRTNAERHSITLKAIGDGVIATNVQGRVELLNPVAEMLCGWNQEEAIGRPLEEVFCIVNEETGKQVENPVDRVMREGMVVNLANHTLLFAKDGTERPIADAASPVRDEKGEIVGAVLVFRDQTDERRSQKLNQTRIVLLEYAATNPLEEFLTKALDEISALVKSPIGFYHFVEADKKTISLQQWSTRTKTEFCRAESKGMHYPVEQAGVWADCARQKKPIIHNNYWSLQNKKGLPEGHAEIIRELVVPVLRKNEVVAILGVGNKTDNYTENDVEIILYLSDVIWEIVERKKTEAERERLLSAIEQAGEMIVITDPEGMIQYVNPAFEQVTGYTRKEVIGQSPRFLKSGKQNPAFYQNLWETISRGDIFQGRLVNKRKDGTFFTEDATISPVREASGRIINYVAVKHDITEHLQLTAQLQQAQKMESVGRLAGGVAHDYNNMLSVILGNTELALDKVDPSGPLHDDLVEILIAAKRSVEITRQLLAFARKQTIAPEVLDVNKTVEGMLKMLRRLIGEDIDLAWLPENRLWPVKMDPSQIEQILANLCVNARDAIAGVGKITIETHMEILDEDYCTDHIGYLPGEFVLLTISDDGCGMDKETLDNIFEPFFTTKDVDQGTGLGLSTVYGIVKQNNGFINVYSEPGGGTTFRIYLPRHEGEAGKIKTEIVTQIPKGLGEKILLVEDEPAIRKMSQIMLQNLGYQVLVADTPKEALRLAGVHAGSIHLLITDVVMPGMNGRDLADQLHTLYPDIKTLFMSGYTADVIANRGVLEEGVNFIQKPFLIKNLGIKVRTILDQE